MELTSAIQNETVRNEIAADCSQLIDRQVSAKSGLSGMALKAAYKVVKGIGADYIPGAISRLLPETCAALDPIWAEGVREGDPVTYLSEHQDRTADTILSTTDHRIANNGNAIIKSSYKKLRKSVKGDVVAAVPELARILKKYV